MRKNSFTDYTMGVMAALVIITCASCCKEDTPKENTRLQEVTDSLRSALQSDLGNTVPSLSVLIETPDDAYFACSAVPGETKVTPDTWFRFASNSKNFTATAVMNMYEDGWLDYKAKITDTIPGTKITYVPDDPEWAIPNKDIITIEQLLQHSAGVYDVDNDSVPGCGGEGYVMYQLSLDQNHQFTSTELISQLTTYHLKYDYQPGEKHHYSNTGYTILGEIAARVYSSKKGITKTLTDYLYDYIYGPSAPVPLKVHFPNLAADQSLPDPYVCGTILNPGIGENMTNCHNNMSAHVAEGNGCGTMAALNTYIRTLMRGENVLEPSTVEIMKTDVIPADSSYGLGTYHVSSIGYGHNGAIYGYLSVMMYDPATDISVITMMPLFDMTGGVASFVKCFQAVHALAAEAKKVAD